MKYSEFKAEVEKLGFCVDVDRAPIYVDKTKGGETIVAIGRQKRFSVNPGWSGFHAISEEEKLAIYNLAHALAITPLAEREEEKRYRLLSVSPMLRKNECGYLLYHKSMGRYFTGSAEYGGDVYQAIFTESEISKMDIIGFDKIEVSND